MTSEIRIGNAPDVPCHGCDAMWFICWPGEHGLVPTDGTGWTHEDSAWTHFSEHRREMGGTDEERNKTVEQLKSDGYVSVRLFLSTSRGEHGLTRHDQRRGQLPLLAEEAR